ncbi:Pyranose dehydrogenase 1 [Lecanosticta acicola]|uniref:Pyranose dehydrogenase 1 n=1 Tax=Lecanosticta acicola TaxID=111012 RepID=A0AAI8YV28_9PEZI|nr:Pyranose dehydrogenase 1 [Lecanosticta acicola]
MEAHPPSYEASTAIDVWEIVAEYLSSRDLCAAALCCSRWHATFVPFLWGNPASHFGIENDAVYVALTHFKRTLQTARLLVRSFTHTLHLPPAHAEIYNGPQADWLREILERLPNLQSLIVRGLPFFDYSTLQALIQVRTRPTETWRPPDGVLELPGATGSSFQRPSHVVPSFGLRLLDASRCPNVTSSGLASALSRFETLLYLDLSFSYPARERAVLEVLREFPGLQVLKLRGIGLKDHGVEILCRSIGLRVRSLDLRDNQVTDRGIRALLDNCFGTHSASTTQTEAPSSGQRSPVLLPYLGSEMLEIYQGEDFEGFLRNAFTGRFVSRLAIEDVPEGGITHLYIAGNPITVEGVSGLVRSERLHVLDVGSVSATIGRHPSQLDGDGERMPMPGIEKLTPVFSKHAADAMSFLRIDHSLITQEAPNLHPDQVVQGRVELGDTSLPYNTNDIVELEGAGVRREAFEMSAAQETPRYELEGDPLQFVVPPAAGGTFKISRPAEEAPTARRGSALAPEAVDSLTQDMHTPTLLSPASAAESTQRNGHGTIMVSSASPAATPGSASSSAPQTPASRPHSYSSMATERTARLTAHISARHNLHPAMLPHLQTLILTDVPPFSPTTEVADRIIHFLKTCAEESSLARKQAALDYSSPPGRKGHASALQDSANRIFALKRLVLELAPEEDGSGGRRSRNGTASSWHHHGTKSLTEDRDSEALWSASETDFSFFADEEEEEEVTVVPPAHTPDGKSVVGLLPEKPAAIDNVARIAAFRKDRKVARQRLVEAGGNGLEEAETEGYWGGMVQVVRSRVAARNDEEMDYYGDKFTNQ